MNRPSRPETPPAEQITAAEWDILKVVWQRQPCAAGDVQEALQESRDWAYTTVKTTMDRMVKKGLLVPKQIRNLTLFSAQVSETEARRGEFRKMLTRAFDGAIGPLFQFLVEDERLSASEIRKLRALLERERRAPK